MIRQIRFQNRRNIEKNSTQKTKKAQNVVFNLKGRIPLLFYCVKHIHGQFKTYLKLRNIHFKQIAKTILFQNHFALYPIHISICTILLLFICHVFIMCTPVAMFSKLVKSVFLVKTLFRGIRWFEQLFYFPLYQISQPFPEQINAKQKLFF
jgi:hypothetical protein